MSYGGGPMFGSGGFFGGGGGYGPCARWRLAFLRVQQFPLTIAAGILLVFGGCMRQFGM